MAAVESVIAAPAAPAASVATAASPQPRALRIGLFVDSRRQPRWVIDAFARVLDSGLGELALIAEAGAVRPRSSLLYKAYGGIDRRAFGAGEDPAEQTDVVTELVHAKLMHFGSDLGSIGQAGADLDVAFALGEFDDTVLDGIARYGVWRFYFGASAAGGDGEAMAGWREVAEGAPLTASGLKVRLAAGTTPRLAYQSWSRTNPFSVARNRAQVLRKTAQFAFRALRELQLYGHGWLEQCKPARQAGASRAAPADLEILKSVSRIGARILQRGVEKALTVEQWFLAYRFNDGRFNDGRFSDGRFSDGRFSDGRGGDARAVAADLKGYTRLMPPKDRYWADPFVLEKNGRYFVFFEELPFKARRAHISMLEIDPLSGRASEPVRVLERDYHLSYPFLVEHDGQLYMIPETAQNGTVEAYRCVDFPRRWKLERVLFDGLRCVDATFHRGADRWWMFANAAAPGSRAFDDELHIFHAERLLGDWQPHRRNPVKSDARCARPAGQLYWRNGALYRPAQICAPLYGSGLSINRVLRLTPHEYAERQVERILPSERDGLLGVHTINRAGDLTVVDAFIRRSRI
jgi:hypothetical protein